MFTWDAAEQIRDQPASVEYMNLLLLMGSRDRAATIRLEPDQSMVQTCYFINDPPADPSGYAQHAEWYSLVPPPAWFWPAIVEVVRAAAVLRPCTHFGDPPEARGWWARVREWLGRGQGQYDQWSRLYTGWLDQRVETHVARWAVVLDDRPPYPSLTLTAVHAAGFDREVSQLIETIMGGELFIELNG